MARRIDFRDLDEPRNNNSLTDRSPPHAPRPPHPPGGLPRPPSRRSDGSKWIVAIAIAVVLIIYFAPVRNKDNLSRNENDQKETQQKTLDVTSTRGWQTTSLRVIKGQNLSFSAVGSWTVDYRNFSYVGPDGYTLEVDNRIYQGCKLDSRFPYGKLLARIGDTPSFWVIGGKGKFTADRDGFLAFRIHDADSCLGDNAGSVTVTVLENRNSPAPSGNIVVLQGIERKAETKSPGENVSRSNPPPSTTPPALKDSHAAGQSTGSPGLPAALLPKLTIGPWTFNGTVASAFVGQWSGTVIQTGSVSDQYPVVITIRSAQPNQRLGAIDYPTLGCSGELILSAASSAQIIVEESLTRGLSACTNHTKVTLTLNADGTLGYSARVSTISGSAVLRSESPSSERKTVAYPQPEPPPPPPDNRTRISPVTFESSCGGSYQGVNGGFTFPSAWCFYRTTDRLPTEKYELRFEARSVDGNGYGVWLRGQWNNGHPRAVGVQFEATLGAIYFMQYPATEQNIGAIKRSLDRQWHRWKIVGDSSSVTFYLDDEQLQKINKPPEGSDFGFRTWTGQLQVKNIVAYGSLRSANGQDNNPQPTNPPAAKPIGCFRDQGENTGTKGRDLNGFYMESSNMTPAACINECRQRGFLYAGTQFSSHCFCGNNYGRSGFATNCNMACSGSSAEICGGSWANSVYEVSRQTARPKSP